MGDVASWADSRNRPGRFNGPRAARSAAEVGVRYSSRSRAWSGLCASTASRAEVVGPVVTDERDTVTLEHFTDGRFTLASPPRQRFPLGIAQHDVRGRPATPSHQCLPSLSTPTTNPRSTRNSQRTIDSRHEELGVVAWRAQPAQSQVLDKRAKLAQAAALDPKRAVVTLVDPEANLIHGADSSLEQAP